MIVALEELGADVDARDVNDFTPLHWAAMNNGEPAIIRALGSAGADVEAHDFTNGWTPLHLAAVGQNPDIVDALLEAGADARRLDNDGKTPWEYVTDSFKNNPGYQRLVQNE